VPIDARQGLVLFGYAVALASMAYSLITAFATRKTSSATLRNRETLPPVSVLKPLFGAQPETYECLRSFCEQAYPLYQVIFGVCDPQDPAVAVVHRLQREFPGLDLVLAVDRKEHGSNRKVNNLINMMALARHDYLVISDSDVTVERDYLARLIPPLLDAGVGIVTCGYRGVPRPGIWSLLGAMYINEWFMPSVRVAALMGYRSFAFGATIAIRRETLYRIGGFNSVSNQLADDYRLGELTRQLGLRTVLSEVEVDTLVEDCTAADLVAHELRWRRTIRNLSPYGYVFSVVTLGLPITALQLLLTQGAAPATAIFSATALASTLIHFNARRPGASTAVLLLVPFRDLLHFGLWIWSFATRRVQWGNDHYEVRRDGDAQPMRVNAAAFDRHR
jgi:ceramide glucosyltransferase